MMGMKKYKLLAPEENKLCKKRKHKSDEFYYRKENHNGMTPGNTYFVTN